MKESVMSNLKMETLEISEGSCNFCNSQVIARMNGEAVGETVTEVRKSEGGGLVVHFCDDCLEELSTWAVAKATQDRDYKLLCKMW
jgi:hypothetical protein